MSWTRVILLVLVLYVAYLLYIPIPENINEKLKYRLLGASVKLMIHACIIHGYIYPGIPSHAKCIRDMMRPSFIIPSGESFAPEVSLRKETFDGVKVHIYTPPEAGRTGLLPGFIYIHGGGMTVLDPDFYDGLTRQISRELKAVVISIDYRQTPEHKFPVPHDDAFKAARWFLQHADQYGVDTKRVAIGGDSSGGYLSATVTQAIYDDVRTPNVKLQVLMYPWLQMLDFKTPSYQIHRRAMNSLQSMVLYSAMYVYGANIDKDIMRAFMTNNHTSIEFRNSALFKERFSHSLIPVHLRDTAVYTEPTADDTFISETGEKIWEESKEVFLDPKTCPLMRKDLSGLPTTYIVTTEYDAIRDDGIIYAKVLEKASVDVTWRHYDNAHHGILWMGSAFIFEDGRKMFNEMVEFVKPKL